MHGSSIVYLQTGDRIAGQSSSTVTREGNVCTTALPMLKSNLRGGPFYVSFPMPLLRYGQVTMIRVYIGTMETE
jgi:hypothetical protein